MPQTEIIQEGEKQKANLNIPSCSTIEISGSFMSLLMCEEAAITKQSVCGKNKRLILLPTSLSELECFGSTQAGRNVWLGPRA